MQLEAEKTVRTQVLDPPAALYANVMDLPERDFRGIGWHFPLAAKRRSSPKWHPPAAVFLDTRRLGAYC